MCGYLFYSCAFLLYSLHREVLKNIVYDNICTKKVQVIAEVRFDGSYGLYGVRVASFINSGL